PAARTSCRHAYRGGPHPDRPDLTRDSEREPMSHPPTLTAVEREVRAERERIQACWGEQNHPDGTGPRAVCPGRLIYAQEAADDARRATNAAAKRGDLTWKHVLTAEVFEAFAEDDPEELRGELVQVVAVALEWIDALDRRAAAPPRIVKATGGSE
ncbi:MAG: hypothetical protein ACRDNL_10910, partial [Spirillospora sp.]